MADLLAAAWPVLWTSSERRSRLRRRSCADALHAHAKMASTELDDLLDRAEALNLHAAVDALTDAEARKQQAQNVATESEALAALAHLRWQLWRAEHPSELPLDNDAMACLARGLDGAELLAFSLSCKQFNAARKAAR